MSTFGSIKKRGDRWQALWDAPAGLDGKRRQKAATFRTQREAKAHLASVATQLNAGTYAEPSKQPFAHYLEREWLPAIAGTVRPATHQRYAAVVTKQMATHDIGAMPLRSLTGGVLNAFYRELEKERLSPGTRRLVHGVLSHALADAVRWDKLTRNPADAADPPAPQRSKAHSWSERELRSFPRSRSRRSSVRPLAAHGHHWVQARRGAWSRLADRRPRARAAAHRTPARAREGWRSLRTAEVSARGAHKSRSIP